MLNITDMLLKLAFSFSFPFFCPWGLSTYQVIIPGSIDRTTISDQPHTWVSLEICLEQKVDPKWLKEIVL